MVGDEMYGVIISIAGLGAIGGSVLLGVLRKEKPLHVYAMGLSFFGVGVISFGQQTLIYATLPFLLLEGVGESFFTVGGRSYLQRKAVTQHLGKVMAYTEMMQKMGLLIGMVLAGVLASYMSVISVLSLFGGCALLAGTVMFVMKMAETRRSLILN